MKKLALFFACAAALVGFTGCEDDKDPIYQAPTTFVLNQPALQNQYLELTEDGTFELTCSQPDYGYSAIVNYSAEVSLTEDFANCKEIASKGSGTTARMTFGCADLALVLCELHGFVDEETYQDLPAEKVYFRAVARLTGVESSEIRSNVVSLNKVKLYFAVPTPGYIWVIGSAGAFGGWTEPSEANAAALTGARLFEPANAIGSKVYSQTFNIPAGDVTFRLYVALTGWDGGDSWGYKVEDQATTVELVDGAYSSPIVNGKGSFTFAGWPGGDMTITADFSSSSPTINVVAGSAAPTVSKYMYIVGNNADWTEPVEASASVYEAWRIADKNESGVYTGTFELAEGSTPCTSGWYFRIYEQLAGWSDTPWAASADGSNVDVTLGQALPCATGQGCFLVNPCAPGKYTVTLDTNAKTVTVSAAE
ncbi:MAG: SusE domain-containing protein [Muribaculaceae bacterium]